MPNLVMFPHVIQPLHVFEQRYRDLLKDALTSDSLIAMPVLAEGWQSDYEGRPTLESVACLGKVVSHQPMDDGQSNILLLGLQRIKLVDELPPLKSFREATVDLVEDFYPTQGDVRRQSLHDHLLSTFKSKLVRELKEESCLDELLPKDISLAVLTDIVAHTLALSETCKVQLLAEVNVDRRAQILLNALTEQPPEPQREFPPDFSVN